MGFLGFGTKLRIPGPSGPFGVGTTRCEVSGDGVDPYAPTPAPRRVPVQAWYPAQASQGARDFYLDDTLRAALSALTRVPKFLLPHNRSHSVVDAPAVPGRYPVLVFNHGFGSFQKQSTSLLEELTSHGYVVLSVGHPYESLVVQLSDGGVVRWRADLPAWKAVQAGLKDLERRVQRAQPLIERARAAESSPELLEAMNALAELPEYAELAPVLASWTRDTRAVLDALPRLDEGALAPPLRGIVDAEAVGVFGHSLGGILAGQLAMTDGRVRVGMSYDGAQLPPPGATYALAAPFCFVYADTQQVGKTAITTAGMNDALVREGPPGSCGVVLRGANHLNFTDMNNLASMRRALGTIDAAGMAKTLRALTVGFFDHHLKGQPLTGFTPSTTLDVCWLTSLESSG